MARHSPEISIVCPCHNEQSNILPLVTRLQETLEQLRGTFEIILVDDGSTDGTWGAIEIASSRHNSVRGLRLSRNFGHQSALLAGLSQSAGAAVVSMDSDLQHPPEVIPRLMAAWREGAQIVLTRRLDRNVASPLKRSSSRIFYRVFSFMAGIEMKEGNSDFRLLDRQVLDVLLQFAGRDQFLRGSVQWLGFRSVTVPYEAAPRHSGTTKYNISRMVRFAATAVTSFSNRPLRIGIWLGMIVGLLALVELLYVLMMAVSGTTVPGWASTVGVMSFLFAILFVMVGIIGIYISRIYTLLQGRPEFIVTEIVSTGALSVKTGHVGQGGKHASRRLEQN